MTNFSLSAATFTDLTNIAVPPQCLPGQRSFGRPKRFDPVSGRALECLAHAIEYIEDTTLHHDPRSDEAIAAADTVQILKVLNRAVFAGLPSAAPRRSLLRAIVGGWERGQGQGSVSA